MFTIPPPTKHFKTHRIHGKIEKNDNSIQTTEQLTVIFISKKKGKKKPILQAKESTTSASSIFVV